MVIMWNIYIIYLQRSRLMIGWELTRDHNIFFYINLVVNVCFDIEKLYNL